MREFDLLQPVVHHFEGRGWRCTPEVLVAGHRADLVGVDEKTVLAVELKLGRWRQALRQAIAYQVWAPWTYVALPFPRAFAAARHRHRFEDVGVGLLAVRGEEVRTFLPASSSPRLFPALSDLVRTRLERIHESRPHELPENVFIRPLPCGDGE